MEAVCLAYGCWVFYQTE